MTWSEGGNDDPSEQRCPGQKGTGVAVGRRHNLTGREQKGSGEGSSYGDKASRPHKKEGSSCCEEGSHRGEEGRTVSEEVDRRHQERRAADGQKGGDGQEGGPAAEE